MERAASREEMVGFVSVGPIDLNAEDDTPWCDICEYRLGTMRSADGVVACDRCGQRVLEALGHYQRDAAAETKAGKRPCDGCRKKKRAKRKTAAASRRRNR